MKIITPEFEELFKDYPLYSREDESDHLQCIDDLQSI